MLLSTRHARIRSNRFGIQSVVKTLVALDAAWRARKQMAELDARALEDLGLTEADICAERRRSLWDAPQHWRR